jgi:hypothetical protein
MTNPRLPIYDSMVADFYFYDSPANKQPLAQRIKHLVSFHDFLTSEYARILRLGLLSPAIQMFRQQFNPLHFTDEKIIDSLIWAFVSQLKNGGLPHGRIIYC